MTTPRNSVNGAFPGEPMKGPIATQPGPKPVLGRMSSLMGPTQSFFLRESKALGYIISGSLLAATEKNSRKSLVKGKMIMNSLSLFAAISGMILSIMDILNIKLSHFLKMESLNLIRAYTPTINIYNCEPVNPSEKNSPSMQYCYSIQTLFLGILSVMLIFAFFQELVIAGIVENEWKRMCSRPKSNIVLLSAEEKKEQAIEIKEVVELTETSSQPKNEEDIEIIPIQEEEEEMETNFPEPPQDQESSPIENDSSP
uniref:Membrane spanning 4-domains A1 n=1 Tax=Cebus imitator TaxID=2715852 RepID=A0A2K5R7Q4_CEBIM